MMSGFMHDSWCMYIQDMLCLLVYTKPVLHSRAVLYYYDVSADSKNTNIHKLYISTAGYAVVKQGTLSATVEGTLLNILWCTMAKGVYGVFQH